MSKVVRQEQSAMIGLGRQQIDDLESTKNVASVGRFVETKDYLSPRQCEQTQISTQQNTTRGATMKKFENAPGAPAEEIIKVREDKNH